MDRTAEVAASRKDAKIVRLRPKKSAASQWNQYSKAKSV
jgi:hypothetical protein